MKNRKNWKGGQIMHSFYKSYKFSFHGWSNFKLAVVDLETQDIYFNRFGKDYRKLIEKNIFQK